MSSKKAEEFMIRASLGFIFTPDFQQVLLIRKNRPEWQAGKINGLGGKCEGEENFTDCISREVKEEADILISPSDWKEVAGLHWQKWDVKVFAAVWSGVTKEASTLTDEEVEWFRVDQLPDNVMANLRWLIPLSIDSIQTPELLRVEVHYV